MVITLGKSILKDDLLKMWLGQALQQRPGSTFQVKARTCGTHTSHAAHRYSGSSTHPGEDRKSAGGGARGGRLVTPRLIAGQALIESVQRTCWLRSTPLCTPWPRLPMLPAPQVTVCYQAPRLGVTGVLPLQWSLSISHFSSFQPCWSLAKQVMGWPWAILDKPPVPGAWPWMM